jgi:hypothetical protein
MPLQPPIAWALSLKVVSKLTQLGQDNMKQALTFYINLLNTGAPIISFPKGEKNTQLKKSNPGPGNYDPSFNVVQVKLLPVSYYVSCYKG